MTEAVRRGNPDRVPLSVSLTPAVRELCIEMTGGADLFEFFDGCGGGVGINPTVRQGDFSSYLRDLPANAVVGEYGNADVPGEFYHFSRKVFPMADLSS